MTRLRLYDLEQYCSGNVFVKQLNKKGTRKVLGKIRGMDASLKDSYVNKIIAEKNVLVIEVTNI